MKIVVLVLTMLFLTGCREYPEAVGYWRDGVEIKRHNKKSGLECADAHIVCERDSHNYCQTIICDRRRSKDRQRCKKMYALCMERTG